MQITAHAEMMTAATYLGEFMIISTNGRSACIVPTLHRCVGLATRCLQRTTRSYPGIRHVGFAPLTNLETNDFHRDLLAGFGKRPCKHTRTRQDTPHFCDNSCSFIYTWAYIRGIHVIYRWNGQDKKSTRTIYPPACAISAHHSQRNVAATSLPKENMDIYST